MNWINMASGLEFTREHNPKGIDFYSELGNTSLAFVLDAEQLAVTRKESKYQQTTVCKLYAYTHTHKVVHGHYM